MNDCFTADVIEQFCRNRLSGVLAGEVSQHIDECSTCHAIYAGLSSAPLAGKLRQELPTSAMPEAAGSTVPDHLRYHPRWEFLDSLGSGGMGAVYLARSRERPQRLRAVKIIKASRRADVAYARRFEREIRVLLEKLPQHENLIRGYGSEWLDDEALLLEMEYVRGVNLEEFARRLPDNRLPVDLACGLALQVLAGLAAAAQRDVVHRDIKPTNLVIDQAGVVKVLDFGLARIVAESTLSGFQSMPGECLGTPAYCAPEQIADPSSVDSRADLYSLGCTLYRLLTGHPPFGLATGHVTPQELFGAHAHIVPRSLCFVHPGLPAGLAAAMDRLLAKDRGQRFVTAQEAAAALWPFADLENRARAEAWVPENLRQRAAVELEHKESWAWRWIGGASAVATLLVLAIVLVSQGWTTPAAAPQVNPTGTPGGQPGQPPPHSAPANPRLAVHLKKAFGRWRREGERLIIESVSEKGIGDEQLVFGDPAWTDYTFSFEVKKLYGVDGASAIFRAPGGRRCYLFVAAGFGSSRRRFEFVDEIWHSIDNPPKNSNEAPLPELTGEDLFPPDIWHRLRVEVAGRRALCYHNDALIFDYPDVRFPTGRVGIRSQGITAEFRNIRVVDPAGKVLWEGLPELPEAR